MMLSMSKRHSEPCGSRVSALVIHLSADFLAHSMARKTGPIGPLTCVKNDLMGWAGSVWWKGCLNLRVIAQPATALRARARIRYKRRVQPAHPYTPIILAFLD
jgi:hypothetical protein